jgi:histidinol-phosphatase
VSVTSKADGSSVTVADHEVEQLLRAHISSQFPDDCLIGEEFGSTGDAERKWIIDPIDGTSYFARNDPNWRIHLALQVGDHIELAVVAAPALGLRWWAQRGSGAFEADWTVTDSNSDELQKARHTLTRTLRVSGTRELGSSQTACAPEQTRQRLPVDCGVAAPTPLPLVELVRGEIDAFVAEGFYLWDHAPWILLVEEAGGRFTDRNGGNRGDQGGGVYSNARVHEALTKALDYRSV